jgi:hypothetical protein
MYELGQLTLVSDVGLVITAILSKKEKKNSALKLYHVVGDGGVSKLLPDLL